MIILEMHCIVQLVLSCNVIMCAFFKAWKERYFVLQDGKMIYYKDRKKVCI